MIRLPASIALLPLLPATRSTSSCGAATRRRHRQPAPVYHIVASADAHAGETYHSFTEMYHHIAGELAAILACRKLRLGSIWEEIGSRE
ncbi:hypothetical protein GQ53DRAFT_85196 [Thozetella sp. PMI_491]|nr:hypothetical protein GQ53DRAFT_85196 [Thozetella sp. PMI_491]